MYFCILNLAFNLRDIIRWWKMYINRTIKCLKRLPKQSIDDNLRHLVLMRQDRLLVNWSTCFFTSDCGFFLLFQNKWVGQVMGNEAFYGDGLIDMYGLIWPSVWNYWLSSFFTRLWIKTECKSPQTWKRKKEWGQYPAIVTEQAWSIKDLLYGFSGIFFLRGLVGSPEWARWM